MVAIYLLDHKFYRSGPSAMTLKRILYEATMEVLEGLGEETMQALIWQLNTRGVNLARDSFDLHVFAVELHELLGEGAESLLEEIYQNIVCRMELIDELEPTASSFGIIGGQSRRLSALQKIQDVFGEGEDGAS
jgi:hypothetical protein